MKYKTAFRLALKAIGVWLLAQEVTSIAYLGGMLVALWRDPSQVYMLESAVQMGISAVLGTGVGLYLFLGGKWIANLAIPSNRPYCHECGYELTGNVTGICPECGTPNLPPQTRTPGSAE